MKRLSALFGTALLVLLAVAASPVRADYMNWSYTADPNVPGISVGGSSPQGGASVTLTDFQNASPGGSSIPVIAYVTSTTSSTPIMFGPSTNTPSTYTLAVKITDGQTHDSGTLSFTGSLVGSLTATTSGVVNMLTPVTSNSLTLDGHKYTVNIPNVTLAPPNSPQTDIMAAISVTNATTGGGSGGSGGSGGNGGGNQGGGGTHGSGGGGAGGQVQGAPEPSCLLLSSLGLSCLGIGSWWRRRTGAKA